MQSGDVIVSVDGKTVASADRLGEHARTGSSPATSVPVVVDRTATQKTVDVTLGARPLPTQTAVSTGIPPRQGPGAKRRGLR